MVSIFLARSHQKIAPIQFHLVQIKDVLMEQLLQTIGSGGPMGGNGLKQRRGEPQSRLGVKTSHPRTSSLEMRLLKRGAHQWRLGPTQVRPYTNDGREVWTHSTMPLGSNRLQHTTNYAIL